MLTLLIFLPLAGVLALLLLRRDDHTWIRRVALAIALVEFVLSLLLLRGFAAGSTAYQFEELRDWIPSPPIHYHLGVDGISLFLVLLTTFLMPVAMLASWKSIEQRVQGFFITLLVLETGMVGVFVSLDLFLFFLFWEAMLIPMYFLIGIWGHERRIYAALKFILYTMLGSILMLVAMVWLYELSGTFDLPQHPGHAHQRPTDAPAAHRDAAVRRFFPGVRDQGAALPAAHLAARRAHRSAHGRLGGAGRRAAEDGDLRHGALLRAACFRRRRIASRRTSPCWPSSASSMARWWPWCRPT